MAFWIMIMCLLLVIVIGILVYRQDNQAFSQLTGYSLFDIVFKPKANYYNALMKQLENKGVHKILLDVKIPTESETVTADAILLHTSGVYVVTGVHKKGWITGDERQAEWYEVLHKGHEVFDNPIIQNKRNVFALQKLLSEVNAVAFHSVVVFSNACSFQKVETYSPDVEVLKLAELNNWFKSQNEETLTIEEIARVYKALEPYTSFQDTVKPAAVKLATN